MTDIGKNLSMSYRSCGFSAVVAKTGMDFEAAIQR